MSELAVQTRTACTSFPGRIVSCRPPGFRRARPGHLRRKLPLRAGECEHPERDADIRLLDVDVRAVRRGVDMVVAGQVAEAEAPIGDLAGAFCKPRGVSGGYRASWRRGGSRTK